MKANAALQVAAGGLFALGIAPRPLGRRGSVRTSGPAAAFFKNASILGGLVFAALDTGGRPSVFWRGRQLAGELGRSISAATSSVSDGPPT